MTTTQDVGQLVEDVNRTHLARQLGLTRVYVSQVLSGKKSPSLSVTVAIAEKLGVTLDDFTEFLQNASVN